MMEEEDDFLQTRITFGLVLRTDLRSIELVKKYIASLDIKPIYQRVTTNRLYIQEEANP